jgi:hypothetical protein
MKRFGSEIHAAVKSGKLIQPFNAAMVKQACPGSGAGVGKTRTVPDDVAETVGEIVGELMLFAGLYYSTRWSIKLSGHTYEIVRWSDDAFIRKKHFRVRILRRHGCCLV